MECQSKILGKPIHGVISMIAGADNKQIRRYPTVSASPDDRAIVKLFHQVILTPIDP